MHKHAGFSLVEIFMMLAIVGILTALAVPSYANYVNRNTLQEALQTSSELKPAIIKHYTHHRQFPHSNDSAGLSHPEGFASRFVDNIKVTEGAVHITLSANAGIELANTVISLRPALNSDDPNQISWLCGYTNADTSQQASGENLTTAPANHLPLNCRG